jgi:hypothetical protein
MAAKVCAHRISCAAIRGSAVEVSDSTARLQDIILARMNADDHGMPRIERKNSSIEVTAETPAPT